MNDYSHMPHGQVFQGKESARHQFQWYRQIRDDGLSSLVGTADAIAQYGWKIGFGILGDLIKGDARTAQRHVRILIQRGHLRVRKKGGTKWGANAVNEYEMVIQTNDKNVVRREDQIGDIFVPNDGQKCRTVRTTKMSTNSTSKGSTSLQPDELAPADLSGAPSGAHPGSSESLSSSEGGVAYAPPETSEYGKHDTILNSGHDSLNTASHTANHATPIPNQERATRKTPPPQEGRAPSAARGAASAEPPRPETEAVLLIVNCSCGREDRYERELEIDDPDRTEHLDHWDHVTVSQSCDGCGGIGRRGL